MQNKLLALLTSAALLAVGSTAFAGEGPTVKLGGKVHAQFGSVSQKGQYDLVAPYDSSEENNYKLSKHHLVNDTDVRINVDGMMHELGYGAFIKLHADTSSSKYGSTEKAQQTMVYLQGPWGRLEAGSYHDATEAMQVGINSIARAAGGGSKDGDAKLWWGRTTPAEYSSATGLTATSAAFLESPALYTNQPTDRVSSPTPPYSRMNANKVTYYTPSFNGLQAGVSYTPDLDVHGTIAKAKTINKEVGTAREVWSGGVHYITQMNNIGFKAALLGQTGRTKRVAGAAKPYKTEGWEAGLAANANSFTLAGSYGDIGRSGLALASSGQPKPKRSKYYTAGLGYEWGQFGASLTHMMSKKGVTDQTHANRLSVTSLGADYKLAPGFMPYIEANWFKTKFKPDTAFTTAKNNKGTIILFGTQVLF